jgi:DNA-binding NtrC family response regulator
MVARVGKSRFPVLILGETGTGKEVVARAIHDIEARGPFVVVDCSSIAAPLMESELFGYAKGAFTGAHNQKLGLLDAANGGTAFFDEIGELPLELQVKLLRVLQEKEFRAVGGVSQRSSNFRVIAATNRNLALEVQEKRFRQDLYFRLNVMRVRIPPLRDRKEDIPALVFHFVERYGNGHHFSTEVIEAFRQYDWPGNVRELEHTVQQMLAMNSGPQVGPGDLPSQLMHSGYERQLQGEILGGQPRTVVSPSPTHSPTPEMRASGILPLAEVERLAILHALEHTKGDRTLAAMMLGIGRTTLYRKLKEYGL